MMELNDFNLRKIGAAILHRCIITTAPRAKFRAITQPMSRFITQFPDPLQLRLAHPRRANYWADAAFDSSNDIVKGYHGRGEIDHDISLACPQGGDKILLDRYPQGTHASEDAEVFPQVGRINSPHQLQIRRIDYFAENMSTHPSPAPLTTTLIATG